MTTEASARGERETDRWPWSEVVHRAVDQGILQPSQGEALLELAASMSPVRGVTQPVGRPRAWLAEALGYVGAALAVTAGLLLAGQFWSDLGEAVHVATLALVTVALLSVGATVDRHESAGPLWRLGSVLWVLAVVGVAATAGVVAGEALALPEMDVAVWTATPAAVAAVALWRLRPRSLQEATAALALAAALLAGVARVAPGLTDFNGLWIWGLGVVWFALASTGHLHPARSGIVVGAVGLLVGPLFILDGRWGVVLGLATAAVLIALSVPMRATVALALAVLGLFVYVPQVVFAFFGEELGAPVALLLSGVVLLAVSLAVARARPAP